MKMTIIYSDLYLHIFAVCTFSFICVRHKVFLCVVFLQLSVPDKVLIPERYVESDPEEALSPEQEADKQRKVDRIKALIAKNR